MWPRKKLGLGSPFVSPPLWNLQTVRELISAKCPGQTSWPQTSLGFGYQTSLCLTSHKRRRQRGNHGQEVDFATAPPDRTDRRTSSVGYKKCPHMAAVILLHTLSLLSNRCSDSIKTLTGSCFRNGLQRTTNLPTSVSVWLLTNGRQIIKFLYSTIELQSHQAGLNNHKSIISRPAAASIHRADDDDDDDEDGCMGDSILTAILPSLPTGVATPFTVFGLWNQRQ